MRSAAEVVAAAGADVIDINMGCPVPKVCKTGAGAALLRDPDTAVAVARAAAEGSGLPVTVKLRSGQRPGETDGFELAHRLVDEAGVGGDRLPSAQRGRPPQGRAGLRPRRAAGRVAGRAGDPDRRACAAPTPSPPPTSAPAPTAVMLARGSLGNPWLFEQLLGTARRRARRRRRSSPSCAGWSSAPSSTSASARAARLAAQGLPVVRRAARHRRRVGQGAQRGAAAQRVDRRARMALCRPPRREPRVVAASSAAWTRTAIERPPGPNRRRC